MPSTYVPRKWYKSSFQLPISFFPFFLIFSSATGRLITAKDHASVQISIADVDPETGLITGTNNTFCLSGYVRNMSEGNDSMDRLCTSAGLLKNVWSSSL